MTSFAGKIWIGCFKRAAIMNRILRLLAAGGFDVGYKVWRNGNGLDARTPAGRG